jgi:hypothetical protein
MQQVDKRILNNRSRCFPWGPCRGDIRGQRRSLEGVENSSRENGVEFSRWQSEWLRGNCKKGSRRCKEDFMYEFRLQWDCDKSVARIRLVKAEYPSACATAKWKFFRTAIKPIFPVVQSCVNVRIRCNKSNHPILTPSMVTNTRNNTMWTNSESSVCVCVCVCVCGIKYLVILRFSCWH